jgi:phosphonate transport system substrate-binding protein
VVTVIPRVQLILLSTALLAAGSGPDDEIRIGLIPERNVFEQVERYEGLAEHLSQELRKPFRLTMLSRYGNIIDRIRSNEIQAAVLGSCTGALATAQLGMEPLARPVNPDGTSTYHGLIFVRRDSGIETLADMKGKRLALVERATTAGYLFPLAFFRQQGVRQPEAFLAEMRFWGSHDAVIEAVLSREADIGAAKNTVFEWLQETDPRVASALKILSRSPAVPSNGLFVARDMDSRLKIEIRDLLLGLHLTVEGKAIFQRMGVTRFVPTSKEDYRPVFELAAEAGIDLGSYSYLNQ